MSEDHEGMSPLQAAFMKAYLEELQQALAQRTKGAYAATDAHSVNYAIGLAVAAGVEATIKRTLELWLE